MSTIEGISQITTSLFSSRCLDDDFLESYRKLLFGQYQSTSGMIDDHAAKAEADEIVGMIPEKVTWNDLYRLELAMIRLAPDPMLRRKAWILRNEYKEMANPDEYKDYLASKYPDADSGDPVMLRADLVRLQEELNWRYVVVWMLESYRSNLLQSLMRWTILIVLLSVVLTYWSSAVALVASWTNFNLPFLMSIVVPGIVGGLISTVQRIQVAHFDKNADLDLAQLERGNSGIYLSPFLGGVFALVLFFLFAGGFVMGDLFPKVTVDSLLVSGIESLEYKDMAKIVIWSFLAGFAEKLVPDRLQQIAQKNGTGTSGRQD